MKESLYHKVVQSLTLPGHPVGTVMTEEDDQGTVFVIWDSGQGRRGGQNCKIQHLKVLEEKEES